MMLPEYILNHLYYQDTQDEQAAKTILEKSASGNFLFCKGRKQDEICLVYKAMFRGKPEIRSTVIEYQIEEGVLNSRGPLVTKSMGRHTTLYSLSQGLGKFLQGWTSELFTPVPLYQESDLSEHDRSVLENQYIAEYHAEQEMVSNIKQKLLTIFNIIHEKIPPEEEGEVNPEKKLTYAGYSISEPQKYSTDEVICKISSLNCTEGALVFISSYNIRLLPCSRTSPILKEQNLLERLTDVCTHGGNEVVDQPSKAKSPMGGM